MDTIGERVARLKTVQGNPGFLAFARILGLRIAEGRTLDAFRMLCDVGASPAIAHKIVEGWITPDTAKLLALVPPSTEAAVRLSFFIPEYETAPWPELLRRSVEAADAARVEEAPGRAHGSGA